MLAVLPAHHRPDEGTTRRLHVLQLTMCLARPSTALSQLLRAACPDSNKQKIEDVRKNQKQKMGRCFASEHGQTWKESNAEAHTGRKKGRTNEFRKETLAGGGRQRAVAATLKQGLLQAQHLQT